MNINPAKQYTKANDLWVVSCFYNSNNYVTKPKNFEIFIEAIESSGLNYLIIECAFQQQEFTLKKSPHVLRLRTPDVMWQKERLLNIAIEHLPAKCRKIAWVDCDVVFENPDWAKETSEQLNHYKIVQPFREAIRLPKGAYYYNGIGERHSGFGFVFKNNPLNVTEGKFELHGHTGFAWASHKSILKKHGFYDACIAGTADHIMAHTFTGDWDTSCVKRVFGTNTVFYEHYLGWSKKMYSSVRSKVSYVDGVLLHLWHGEIADRKYTEREKVLEKFRFNPATDLQLNENNCWKWNHSNKELKHWAEEYFVLRKED